jgi:hypothetical protein
MRAGVCAFALALLAAADGRKYAVEKGPDVAIAAGSRGAVTLRLLARDDGFFPPDAPLHIKLVADGAVNVERSLLQRDDAVDPRGGARAQELQFRIAIAAAPGAAGSGTIKADLLFYIGTSTWARAVREQVSWGVTVR